MTTDQQAPPTIDPAALFQEHQGHMTAIAFHQRAVQHHQELLQFHTVQAAVMEGRYPFLESMAEATRAGAQAPHPTPADGQKEEEGEEPVTPQAADQRPN